MLLIISYEIINLKHTFTYYLIYLCLTCLNYSMYISSSFLISIEKKLEKYTLVYNIGEKLIYSYSIYIFVESRKSRHEAGLDMLPAHFRLHIENTKTLESDNGTKKQK